MNLQKRNCNIRIRLTPLNVCFVNVELRINRIRHYYFPSSVMGGQFNDLMHNLGIREAFTPDADFSALSAGSLIADAMIHQAKIEVDRNGARASAATAIILYGCCPPEEVKRVIIDRPFVFAVLNRELEIPVFVGVVNHMDPVS